MKTNKHQTLLLAQKNSAVLSEDLVNNFDYSGATARSYLSHLAKQNLLQRTGAGYALTKKGEERLEFFAAMGCDQAACPLCEGKAGLLTCPVCGYRFPRQQARLRPERKYFYILKRPAGVHCPICWSLILNEGHARLVEISKEGD